MQRIPQVLKLAVVIQRRRAPFVFEPELLEEFDLFRRGAAAKRTVLEKFPQTRLFLRPAVRMGLDKLKSLQRDWSDLTIQDDFDGKSGEVDIPRCDQRVQ